MVGRLDTAHSIDNCGLRWSTDTSRQGHVSINGTQQCHFRIRTYPMGTPVNGDTMICLLKLRWFLARVFPHRFSCSIIFGHWCLSICDCAVWFILICVSLCVIGVFGVIYLLKFFLASGYLGWVSLSVQYYSWLCGAGYWFIVNCRLGMFIIRTSRFAVGSFCTETIGAHQQTINNAILSYCH